MTAPITDVRVLRCPICRCGFAEESVCAHCGWLLSGGPWLDSGTAERRRRFDDQFAAAARHFDLVAAVRGAGYPQHGDAALLTEMIGLMRGGTPAADEIAAAREARGTATRPVWEVLRPALRRLADSSGGDRALSLVDIDVDGVTTCTLRVDRFGAPVSALDPHRIPWRTLFPTMPEASVEARFWLAGGIGENYCGPCEVDRDAWTGLVPRADAMTELLVLHRLPDWPAPDTVATLLPLTHRVHGPAIGAEFFRGAYERAPLRVGHGVLLVDIDRDGATTPVVYSLFPAGETAETSGTVALTVAVPKTTDELVVAVVAATSEPESPCPPVDIARWPVPTGTATTTLEFALAGPGAVTLVRPFGARRDSHRMTDWRALLDDIPPQYRPPDHAMDLVLAVELGGTVEVVTARRTAIRAVLHVVESSHPDPGSVRAAVVGYRDHRARDRRNITEVHPFGSLRAAAAAVEHLSAVATHSPDAAPLEDALAEIRSLAWRSDIEDKRLLVLGGRSPHPPRDDLAYRCPHGHDWRAQLSALRRSGVQALAICDTPAVDGRRSRIAEENLTFWRAFSRPRDTLQLAKLVAQFGSAYAEFIAASARLLPVCEHPASPLRFPIRNATDKQENSS